jgi:hypothetical protein
MLRRRQHLAGTRLVRACSRLAGAPLSGKTLNARARVVDASGPDERLPSWIIEEAAKRGIAVSEVTAARIAGIASRRTRGYAKFTRGDLAVILCHYNPAGWKRPPALLYDTCESVIGAGLQPTVAQVVLPGQDPARTPDGCRGLLFESSEVMFYKENLWNLAAEKTTESKLLFMDADIFFSRRDIFDAISDELNKCDIIQPFTTACWLGKSGNIQMARESSASAMCRGVSPNPRVYHPGFAWAMTRAAFGSVGGFYERHPVGGGDMAFVYAIAGLIPDSLRRLIVETESYCDYVQRVSGAGLRLSVLPGTVYHAWHGDMKHRQYEQRYSFAPATVGNEFPIKKRTDGLLEWESRESSEALLRYFSGRHED